MNCIYKYKVETNYDFRMIHLIHSSQNISLYIKKKERIGKYTVFKNVRAPSVYLIGPEEKNRTQISSLPDHDLGSFDRLSSDVF